MSFNNCIKTTYNTLLWLPWFFKRFPTYCCFKMLKKFKMAQMSLGTSLEVRFQTLISEQKLEK